MEQHSHEENVQKLGELIKKIDFGMMTTVDDDGSLHSRPMSTQRTEFDGSLWFFTELDSHKVAELERDHNVNISYAKPEDQIFVSVSGTGRLVRDQAKAKELWNPIYKAWFPKGLDDPNLALLRVDVDKAEYWDSPSSKVVQLIGFAKAILTGQRSQGEGSEHGIIDL